MAKNQKPIIRLNKRDVGWAYFRKWKPVKLRPVLCVIKTKGDFIICCPITKKPPSSKREKRLTIKIDFNKHIRSKKTLKGSGYIKLFQQHPIYKRDIKSKMGTIKDFFWKEIEKKLNLYNKERLAKIKK